MKLWPNLNEEDLQHFTSSNMLLLWTNSFSSSSTPLSTWSNALLWSVMVQVPSKHAKCIGPEPKRQTLQTAYLSVARIYFHSKNSPYWNDYIYTLVQGSVHIFFMAIVGGVLFIFFQISCFDFITVSDMCWFKGVFSWLTGKWTYEWMQQKHVPRGHTHPHRGTHYLIRFIYIYCLSVYVQIWL